MSTFGKEIKRLQRECTSRRRGKVDTCSKDGRKGPHTKEYS
jgi:hypothetical protein